MISRMDFQMRMPLSIVLMVVFTGLGLHLFTNPELRITQDTRTVIYSVLFALVAIVLFLDSFQSLKRDETFASKAVSIGILASTLIFIVSLTLKATHVI